MYYYAVTSDVVPPMYFYSKVMVDISASKFVRKIDSTAKVDFIESDRIVLMLLRCSLLVSYAEFKILFPSRFIVYKSSPF